MTTLLRSQLLILFLSNFASLATYLVQIYLGHTLSTSDFGTFNAINALGTIVLSLFNLIQTLTARNIAELGGSPLEQATQLRALTRFTWISTLITTGGLWLFTPLLTDYLHLETGTALLIYSSAVVATYFFGLYAGALNGLFEYVRTTSYTAAAYAFRLAFTLLLVGLLQLRHFGALAAITLGTGVATYFLKKRVDFRLKSHRPEVALPANEAASKTIVQKSPLVIQGAPILLQFIAINLLTQLDVVWAKAYLSADTAGMYSGVTVIARIAAFLPLMLISLLLPEAAKAPNEKSAFKVLVQTLLLAATVSGSFVILTALFPTFFLNTLLGGQYLAGASLLPKVGLVASLSTLIQIVAASLFARRSQSYLAGLGAGIASLLIWVKVSPPQAPEDLVRIFFFSNLLSFCVLFGLALWRLRIRKTDA